MFSYQTLSTILNTLGLRSSFFLPPLIFQPKKEDALVDNKELIKKKYS